MFSFGQSKQFPDLEPFIGKTVYESGLGNYMLGLDSVQYNESFNLALNEYEMRIFSRGVDLVFNQNFVLKEVRWYRSGNLYTKHEGSLPYGLTFDKHKLTDFDNYKYPEFEVDSFNKYVYHRVENGLKTKLYFRKGTIELVKLTATDSLLQASDYASRALWGIRIVPDGKCIKGNCFMGSGEMQWPTSLQYSGNWESGISHGFGSFMDSTGITYIGDFKLGFLWGDGSLQVPGQYNYTGDFMFGRRMGNGKATFQNGTRYRGQWFNDKMQGYGHFWFSETYHYEGQFVNNQFNGRGTLFSPEGHVEGTFKNGRPHGYCKQVNITSKSTLAGNWVNGKKEGVFELTSPVTGTRKITFKNDIEIQ
jgi:hypothetical protein